MARKDPEATKAYDRARKAAKRAEVKANEPEPKSKPTKPPGKTPFASFIKVKEGSVRNAGEKGEGLFYFDLIIGPITHHGVRYDLKAGQLQITTCLSERRRPTVQGPFYVSHLRPLIIRGIEKHISNKRGQPYRFHRKYQFTPEPRKPRTTQVEVAA